MEEDWEVVSVGSSVDWEEVARSASSRSASPGPTPTLSEVAVLEAQLRDANARATLAELRARDAESQTHALRAQLADAREHSRALQVVVQQQRIENDQLTAALLTGRALPAASISTQPSAVVLRSKGKQAARAKKEKKISKAKQSVAPQSISLPKRTVWSKANYRSTMTCARFI